MKSNGSAGNGTKFLISGTGAIVGKLKPTWELYADLNIELYAADICDNPAGRSALPEKARFFNWKNSEERQQLIEAGWDRPFDFVYLSTYPSVHIFTALRLDFIAKQFIFPKPVDSNFSSMQTLFSEYTCGRSVNLVSRSCVHDHYRNKPITKFLRAQIADLHRRNGYLKNVRIFITEWKSIQNEFQRRESLECGIMLDLGPHALSVAYEVVPNTLSWQSDDGDNYKRVSRRFEIVSASRGRDNLSILHNQDKETFAAIHLRGLEEIEFTPKSTVDHVERICRPFDVLIVVGKGVSVNDRAQKQDLKAIELEFDGQIVRGNFDTNALSGVVDKDVQKGMESKIDTRHRGLNLPLQELGTNRFDLEKLNAGGVITPFQNYEEAFAISSLLEDCSLHHTSRTLNHYHANTSVADLVNRCVKQGLSSKWALDEDDVARLIFGESPRDSVA